MKTGQLSAADAAARRQEDPQDLPGFCAYPVCRKEYRRTVGPGRPQLYCTELCRRHAEKDQRQLRSRLQHFEGVVQQARIDLAAYGLDDGSGGVSESDLVRRAEVAVAQAATALRFVGSSEDPAVQELRNLHAAVAPILGDLQKTSRPTSEGLLRDRGRPSANGLCGGGVEVVLEVDSEGSAGQARVRIGGVPDITCCDHP